MSNPEAAFWQWFADHSEHFRTFDPNTDPEAAGRILDQVMEQLSNVCEGLTCELSTRPPSGCQDFIVSADGIKERFAPVRRLVAAAPSLPGWQIIAFRPRQELDYPVVLDGRTIKPADVWFRALPDGQKVDLGVFLPGLTAENRDSLVRIGYILLDMALGEYDVEMKIGGIDWKALPPDPAKEGLKPYRDLPSVVDSLLAQA
jgi:hypothetical protein